MVVNLTRFAVLPAGDRLIAAVLHRGRLDTFFVVAEQPAVALRAEIDARKLRPVTVAIGLPRSSVVVKPIELPEISGALRDMVRFELERHLPFAPDDAPFDFIQLPAEPDGAAAATATTRRVLVVAADRRVLDSALRIAEEARLRPVSVTVAAHELVSLVDPDPKRRVVWAHGVGDSIDLLFLVGATVVLSRSIPAEAAELVAAEIKRSLALLRWRGCDAIWVSGDGSAGDATGALAALEAPVGEPPYNVRARRWLGSLEQDGRGARELAAAVVMARGVRPLDLLPLPMRPRRLTRPQLMTTGSGAAAVALGILALLVPGYRDSRRLTEVNAAITTLDPEVRAVENTLQELERKRRLLATIESVDASAIKPLPVLRDLTDLLPNDAWLTMMSLDSKGVELTGQAAAASALIPLLENSPRLERVEFASPVTRGRDREQFRIQAKWEGAGATVVIMPTAAPAAPPAGAQRPSAGRALRSTPGAGTLTPTIIENEAATEAPARRPGMPNLGGIREPRP